MEETYEREYNIALAEIRRLRNVVDRLEAENEELRQLAFDYDWYLRWQPSCPDEDDARHNLRWELDRRITAVRNDL